MNICQFLLERHYYRGNHENNFKALKGGASPPPLGSIVHPIDDPLRAAAMRLFISEADVLIRSFDKLLRYTRKISLGHSDGGGEDQVEKNLKSSLQSSLHFMNSLLEEQHALNNGNRRRTKDDDDATGGPFFLGMTMSLADVALIPFLDRFRYSLQHYCNFDIFGSPPPSSTAHDGDDQRNMKKPPLQRLMEAAEAESCVQPTLQSKDVTVRVYAFFRKPSKL